LHEIFRSLVAVISKKYWPRYGTSLFSHRALALAGPISAPTPTHESAIVKTPHSATLRTISTPLAMPIASLLLQSCHGNSLVVGPGALTLIDPSFAQAPISIHPRINDSDPPADDIRSRPGSTRNYPAPVNFAEHPPRPVPILANLNGRSRRDVPRFVLHPRWLSARPIRGADTLQHRPLEPERHDRVMPLPARRLRLNHPHAFT
jgi:hypothetical protein